MYFDQNSMASEKTKPKDGAENVLLHKCPQMSLRTIFWPLLKTNDWFRLLDILRSLRNEILSRGKIISERLRSKQFFP